MTATSYDAQLQIRRDAEERSRAHQDLGLWMDNITNPRCKAKAEKGPTNERVTTAPTAPKDKLATVVNDARNILTDDHCKYEEERMRGNDDFKQGKYEDAIKCYTRCLGMKDALASPLVYSNRGKCVIMAKDRMK